MNSCKSIDLLELILVLDLEYIDKRIGLYATKRALFSLTTTIYDVTKTFLEIPELDFIDLENVNLVSVRLNEEHYPIPLLNAHKTLDELNIDNGSILRFESGLSEPRGRSLKTIIIRGPNNNKKIRYSWNKATTLGSLLKVVIKAFHLESVEEERIRLVTISDTEINLLANSHVHFSSLGFKNGSTIWIKLIDFPHNENVCVHIKFAYSDRTPLLYISPTNTIAELNNQIKSYVLIVHELYTETNKKLDLNDCHRRLEELGVQSGQIIYANLHLGIDTINSIKSEPVISSHILPTGLKNRKNSCFMNSALQCLARVMPLTQYFLESIDRTQRNVDNAFDSCGEVTGAYVELLCKLWRVNYSDKAFVPKRIRTAMSRLYPWFATGDQQDAQEFLSFLLNTIHEELHSSSQSNRKTIIEKLFFGKMESMTTCLRCDHVTKKIEKLSLLSVPLSRQQREFTINFRSKNGHRSQSKVLVLASGRIEHLVEAFVDKHRIFNLFDRIIVQTTETEEALDFKSPLYMLTDSNIRLIEQKKRLIRTRPIQLDIDPNKITLYECLQEFISIEYLKDSWLCEQEKCRQKTKLSKQLQLYTLPPVLIIQLKRFASENGRQKKIETFVEYPIDGLDLRDQSTSRDAIYDLIAVSNHTGSLRHGHYTAYARQEVSTDQWYEFDDAVVSTISSNSKIVTADAYLLFYMKRNYQSRQKSQQHRDSFA